MKPIDMHVHLVGIGASGTGCSVRLRLYQRALSLLMLRQVGLPLSALKTDFDQIYIERLRQLVRESSLGSVVILAQDHVYSETGQVMHSSGSFYVPNDYALGLARRYPEFIPAVAIHPARVDALAELERCLAEGASMLKILPNCQNIDCNDRRYMPFWERMAGAGLPLLAHTGGETTLPVVRRDLSDPRTLQLPLDCGVTVIAAHCGTRSHWLDRDYFPVFCRMLECHPRLYGDISAFNLPLRGEHILQCLQPPVIDRLVHGSDYPVPVLGSFSWMRGYVNWATYRQWQRHPNMLERDYQLKKAMGFPEETFTRIHLLLRRTSIVRS